MAILPHELGLAQFLTATYVCYVNILSQTSTTADSPEAGGQPLRMHLGYSQALSLPPSLLARSLALSSRACVSILASIHIQPDWLCPYPSIHPSLYL